jgi:hypothetical protein
MPQRSKGEVSLDPSKYRIFETSAREGGDMLHAPADCVPVEKFPEYIGYEAVRSPRAGLDVVARSKMSVKWNPRRPARATVYFRLRYSALDIDVFHS